MTRRWAGAIVVLVAGMVLGACGGGSGSNGPTPTATAQRRPSTPGKLTILKPTTGQVFGPSDVVVKLRLTGAKLTRKVTTSISPNEGHIHLRLDGRTITLLGSLEENVAGLAGKPLSPGPHLLEAEFVASDHGPFDPRVIASVSFTVR